MTTPAAKNHRAVPRVPGVTIGPLRLRAECADESFLARVQDVSILGVGLIAMQAFVSGTILIIEAGPSGKSLATVLKATVRHVTIHPEGGWLIGCAFSRHLVVDDLDALG